MARRVSVWLLYSSLVFFTACSAHVGYRAHDRSFNDYHTWNDAEITYYNSWIVETHRPHVDYRHLHRADQDEYWRWRHDHH